MHSHQNDDSTLLTLERIQQLSGMNAEHCERAISSIEIKALLAEVLVHRANQPGRMPSLDELLAESVEQTVWPKEVDVIVGCLGGISALPEEHLRRVKKHVTRLWLERRPTHNIITAGKEQVALFSNHSTRHSKQEATA